MLARLQMMLFSVEHRMAPLFFHYLSSQILYDILFGSKIIFRHLDQNNLLCYGHDFDGISNIYLYPFNWVLS